MTEFPPQDGAEETLELRRKLLRGGISVALLAPLLGSGLLPHQAVAAEWQRAAFSAARVSDALKIYGAGNAAESRAIVVNAPEIAENGARVDIEISSNLPQTVSLAVFADRNPLPLCGILEFSENALPYARLPLKLSESTRLRVVARTADGKTHIAFRDVKVTLGGCGG